jgi:hypothetical protein
VLNLLQTREFNEFKGFKGFFHFLFRGVLNLLQTREFNEFKGFKGFFFQRCIDFLLFCSGCQTKPLNKSKEKFKSKEKINNKINHWIFKSYNHVWTITILYKIPDNFWCFRCLDGLPAMVCYNPHSATQKCYHLHSSTFYLNKCF